MNIPTILAASKPSDIFDLSNWKTQFRDWAKHLHPDRNPDPQAKPALEILLKFRDILETGIVFSDEICPKITFKDNVLTFTGDPDKLKLSYDNFQRALNCCATIPTFQRYLPERMELSPDLTLKVYLRHQSNLIQDLVLEEKHVKWFLNRLLEFTSMLNIYGGFTHCGINPNSVLICPEEHGIQVISFYHQISVNDKMKSAIGNHPYKGWYPDEIWTTKKSCPEIDLFMCKNTAVTLLGDKTGFGHSLRGKISNDLLEFLLQHDDTIHTGYMNYQTFLDKSPRVFHKLTL